MALKPLKSTSIVQICEPRPMARGRLPSGGKLLSACFTATVQHARELSDAVTASGAVTTPKTRPPGPMWSPQVGGRP